MRRLVTFLNGPTSNAERVAEYTNLAASFPSWHTRSPPMSPTPRMPDPSISADIPTASPPSSPTPAAGSAEMMASDMPALSADPSVTLTFSAPRIPDVELIRRAHAFIHALSSNGWWTQMSNSAHHPQFYDILFEEYMFGRPPGAVATLPRPNMPPNSSSRPFQAAPKIGLYKQKGKGFLNIENPAFEPVVDCLMAGYLQIAAMWGESEAGIWRVHWEKTAIDHDGTAQDGPVLVFRYAEYEPPLWDDDNDSESGDSQSDVDSDADIDADDTSSTNTTLTPNSLKPTNKTSHPPSPKPPRNPFAITKPQIGYLNFTAELKWRREARDMRQERNSEDSHDKLECHRRRRIRTPNAEIPDMEDEIQKDEDDAEWEPENEEVDMIEEARRVVEVRPVSARASDLLGIHRRV